jgi:hypothetical protein
LSSGKTGVGACNDVAANGFEWFAMTTAEQPPKLAALTHLRAVQ